MHFRGWVQTSTFDRSPYRSRPRADSGLVWRTWEGSPNTAPYDVWLAVGRDEGHGGAVFGPPLRVSSEAGAYPPGYTAGDDFSWVTADRKYIYVGWGDSRNADVNVSLRVRREARQRDHQRRRWGSNVHGPPSPT
jgi:hypothetical protein